MARFLNSTRSALVALASLLLAAGAAAQTKLYLHDAASDVSGYKYATVSLGPSNTTAVTNTVTSGTDIQVTKTGGGATVAWITPPFSGSVTISGTATCNVYGGESSNSANSAFRCRFYKYSGGSEGSAILTANMTTELSTNTSLVRNWTGTVSSTNFVAGDRLVIKLFVENCVTSGCPTGSMGNGYTVTAGYDGTTDGSNAASWVQTPQSIPGWQKFGTPATEAVGAASDSVAIAAGRAAGLSEAVGAASDAVARLPDRPAGLSEAVGAASDSLVASRSVTRSLSESVVIGEDTVSRVTGKSVLLSESFTCVDDVSRVPSLCYPIPLIETYPATDLLEVLFHGNTSVGLSEGFSATDFFSATKSHSVSLAESLSAEDSIARGIAKSAAVSETVSVSDSITWTTGKGASLSESLTTSDATATVAAHAAGLSEALTTSDAVARAGIFYYSKNLVEALTVSDSCSAQSSAQSGTCYPVPLIETHVTNDSLAAFRPQFQRTIAEVLTTIDSLTVVKILQGGLSEGFTTTDAILVIKCSALHEDSTTVDSLLALRGRAALISESLTVVDSVKYAVGRRLLEQFTTSDTLLAQKPTVFSLNMADILSVSDSVTTSRVLHGDLAENFSTVDALAAIRNLTVTLAESSFAADSLAHAGEFRAPVSEIIATLDQITSQSNGQTSVGFSDNLSTSDVIAVSGAFGKGLAEPSTVADLISALRGPVFVLSENLSVTTDYVSVARSGHPRAELFETVRASDSLTLSAPSRIIFTESFTTVDEVVVRTGRRRFILIEVP